MNNDFKFICRKDKCTFRRMVGENKAYCPKVVCPYNACAVVQKTKKLPENPTVAEIIQNAKAKGLIC